MGIPDQFIEHGNVNELLEEIDVTTDDYCKQYVETMINQERKVRNVMTKQPKERVDVLLVERGFIETVKRQTCHYGRACLLQMKRDWISQVKKFQKMHL